MGIVARNNLTFEPRQTLLPAESPEVAALAGHLRAGRCALIVGAGLSAPAGLPTWGTLIDEMVVESTPWAVDPDLFPNRLDIMDPARDALRAPPVDAIRAALGRQQFAMLCRRIQRATSAGFDLQVLYKALSVVFHDSIDRAELRKLAETKRYAELAGHCRDRFGPEGFRAPPPCEYEQYEAAFSDRTGLGLMLR